MTRRWLACLFLAGCASSAADPLPPPTKRPEKPPEKQFEQDMMVRFHMHENFGVLHTLQQFLVRGRFDAAKQLAGAMAQAPDEPGLSTWAAQTARVREKALAIANARNLEEALRAEAHLAQACASCHVDSGAQPEFDHVPTLPPDRATVEARMARHVWASDRLWEGMLGNADDSWRSGLDVLAATPLPNDMLGRARTPIAKTLQRLAKDARKETTLAGRADSYGEILVQCAACHAQPAATP